MGVSAEFRYVVMHRTAAVPIQVTLTVQPEYNSIAEAGRQANDFSTTFLAVADIISSDRRLYGAVNLVYAPDGFAASRSAVAGHGYPFRFRRAFLSPDAAADVRRGSGL